jgi:hypothetical protein
VTDYSSAVVKAHLEQVVHESDFGEGSLGTGYSTSRGKKLNYSLAQIFDHARRPLSAARKGSSEL